MIRLLSHALLLLVLVASTAGWPEDAAAQSKGSTWQGFGPSSSGGGSRRSGGGSGGQMNISAGEAAAIVRRTGAKVLDVRRRDGGYSVKLVTPKGRVRRVWVDGSSGRLSR